MSDVTVPENPKPGDAEDAEEAQDPAGEEAGGGDAGEEADGDDAGEQADDAGEEAPA